MRKQIKGEFELDVKRFYFPFILKRKCPVCGYLNEYNFENEYLSYPVLNNKKPVWFCCYECDHEFSVGVMLKLSLEIDDE